MAAGLSEVKEPIAVFRIERVPTKDYEITFEDGQGFDQLRQHALLLLDKISHEDGEIKNDRVLLLSPQDLPQWQVNVRMEIRDSGETIFHQSWFPNDPTSSVNWVRSTVTLMIGLALGFLIWQLPLNPWFGKSSDGLDSQAPLADSPTSTQSGKQQHETIAIPVPVDLTRQLGKTIELRKRLLEYLSQDGWGVHEKITIDEEQVLRVAPEDPDRLPGNLDQHNLQLSTHDLVALTSLLEYLKDLHNVKQNSQRGN